MILAVFQSLAKCLAKIVFSLIFFINVFKKKCIRNFKNKHIYAFSYVAKHKKKTQTSIKKYFISKKAKRMKILLSILKAFLNT